MFRTRNLLWDRCAKNRWPKSETDFTKYLESETRPVCYPEGTEHFLLACKTTCAWSWQSTSFYCRCQGCRDPHLHAPIRLHSYVLNYAQRYLSVFINLIQKWNCPYAIYNLLEQSFHFIFSQYGVCHGTLTAWEACIYRVGRFRF